MATHYPNRLILNATRQEPWELLGQLHILLAYPQVTVDRRQKLVNSVCVDTVATLIEEEPARRAELLQRFPSYNPSKDRTQRQAVIDGLENAQLMGCVILELVKETAARQLHRVKGERTKLSLDYMTRYLWPPKADETDDQYHERMHSVERRQIRDRYPVAHLSGALAHIGREMHAAGQGSLFSYRDLDFLRRWLSKAAEVERLIRATPGLETVAKRLIEIEWIEPEQVFAPGAGN